MRGTLISYEQAPMPFIVLPLLRIYNLEGWSSPGGYEYRRLFEYWCNGRARKFIKPFAAVLLARTPAIRRR